MIKPFGIIPAMVTPLTTDDVINEHALRKLTNHLIAGGIHGVFAMGSQGEFWAFSADEKQIIVCQFTWARRRSPRARQFR
jgi:4-hydroxy-tetrahydrodipicolinate synthase